MKMCAKPSYQLYIISQTVLYYNVSKFSVDGFLKKDIYSVLVRFMRKSSLSKVSGRLPIAYRPNKQPVLLHYYFLGLRLEGLSEKNLAKKFKELTLSQSPFKKERRRGYSRHEKSSDYHRGRHTEEKIRMKSDHSDKVHIISLKGEIQVKYNSKYI